jgi:A/G-specific adenine glycosylase
MSDPTTTNDPLNDSLNNAELDGFTPEFVSRFQQIIYHYYREHGRRLPWRETLDPYHILVSEIMLQQTQVERVVPKYDLFISRFPSVTSLAQSQLRDILLVWQGLGYNRRALSLQQIARRVTDEFNGQIPDNAEILKTFSGIGDATAGAMMAFAFAKPAIFIETNIRRVFLHFFFPHVNGVTDRLLRPLIEKTLDRVGPRRWYYALMDYGVWLKRMETNPNRRSAHHNRQGPFHDSDRQIRGLIVRALLSDSPLGVDELVMSLKRNPQRVRSLISQLVREGFIEEAGSVLRISP